MTGSGDASLRAPAAVACGAACGVTAGLVAAGADGGLALATWGAALAAAVASVRGGWGGSRLSRADALPLLGVTLLAGALRLYRIDELPFGYWIDEAAMAVNARSLVEAGSLRPFGATPLIASRPDWVQTPNLYLYACWLVQAATGFSPLGVKLVSVIPGTLAAPALYALARSIFDRPLAVLASGLLAASSWHVTLSRWGWDEVLATTLCIVTFHFAFRAAAEKRPALALAAGGVAGLALFSYAASQIALLAALCWLGARAAFARGRGDDRNLLVFAGGVAVAALPLLVRAWLEPGAAGVRIRELWATSIGSTAPLAALADNLLRHLLMFHAQGDPNPRHHLPGEPLLDPLTGILFAVGAGVSLVRWRRLESQMALVWLGVGLLAGILSSGPGESPHAYRTGLVAPACCLLAALGARALWERAAPRAPRATLWAGVAAVLALATAATAWGYFARRPARADTWGATITGVEARLIRERIDTATAAGSTVYVEAQLRSLPLELELAPRRDRRIPEVDFPAEPEAPAPGAPGGLAWTRFFGSWERIERALDSGPDVVLILRPELRDEAAARLDAGIREVRTPFGALVAVELHAPRR